MKVRCFLALIPRRDDLLQLDEGLSFSLNAFFMVANFRLYPRSQVGPLSEANPGIFDSGGPNVGSERTVEPFMANYFSQRRPRAS